MLAKQAHEAEQKGKALDAQVRLVEEKLCEQSKARRTCEQELQRQAGDALAATAKVQAEVEDAKRQLKEQLAQRTSELEQMRQGLEARLRAEEDKQREEQEKKSKSEIQRQLQEATAL